MKITPSLAVLSFAAFALPQEGLAQSRVTADAFLSPTAFTFVSGVEDLRVAESYTVPGAAAATHILIEGLVPVEAGSNVVTSNYTGINLTSGEVQDAGRLYFTMPAGASPAGAASSPIVGIVARSGAWGTYSPETPSTDLGGLRGALQVNMTGQTLGINLGGYSGTATYGRIDDQTLEIEDFELSNNGTTLEFYGSQFVLFNGDLYGIVQAKAPANDDSIMYEMNFGALEDFDGDRIPDILDAATGATFVPVINGWKYDRATGWMWGGSEGWGRATSTFDWTFVAAYPWVYLPKEGWIYLARESSGGGLIWIWHHGRSEWVYTTETSSGWFWNADNSGWCHFFTETDNCQ